MSKLRVHISTLLDGYVVGPQHETINHYLDRVVDEIELHVVPILLGGGLFEGVDGGLKLEQLCAVEAPGVTHLKYRTTK